MDLKQLITQFTYHIEPKPEGGFIARPSGPNGTALEAPTREELQQKIRANIAVVLAKNFPGMNQPQAHQLNISFHLERKPDGTFDIHSSDPASPSIQSASRDEVESHFAEKVLNLVGKHLSPEFAQGLATQFSSGDVKVFVSKGPGTKRVSINLNSGAVLGNADPVSAQLTSSTSPANNGVAGANTEGMSANNSSPITPGDESSNVFFRYVIAAIIVIAAMYAYLHFHH